MFVFLHDCRLWGLVEEFIQFCSGFINYILYSITIKIQLTQCLFGKSSLKVNYFLHLKASFHLFSSPHSFIMSSSHHFNPNLSVFAWFGLFLLLSIFKFIMFHSKILSCSEGSGFVATCSCPAVVVMMTVIGCSAVEPPAGGRRGAPGRDPVPLCPQSSGRWSRRRAARAERRDRTRPSPAETTSTSTTTR